MGAAKLEFKIRIVENDLEYSIYQRPTGLVINVSNGEDDKTIEILSEQLLNSKKKPRGIGIMLDERV